ncbi:MAG: beta strand repeat-containing protein [Candidatus Sericytochromatia bacterium]
MKTRSLSACILLSLLATSCQPSAPVTLFSGPVTPSGDTAVALAEVPRYTSPVLPPITLKPEAQVRIQGNRVALEAKLPPLQAQQTGEFKTQLLDLSTAATVTATVTDSYGKSYSPVGADGNGQLPYPANGVINLSFTGVIPDELLFITLQVSDGTADIPQAELATVVKHLATTDVTAAMNFQTTPAAKTLQALLAVDAARARAVNLGDLTSFLASVTGVTGTAPNVSYTTHPSLVDTAALATALRTQAPGDLTPATYRRTGATLSLNVTGLVGSDTLEVQATDAASARKLAVATGSTSLSGITPGSGLQLQVGATAGNSTQYSFSASPNSSLTLADGSTTPVVIVATPATVSITDLAPTAGANGSSVVITGTGFSTTPANNIVKFGSTTATVTAATATSLTVTVPAALFGSQAVTVQVGAQTSNASTYEIAPVISALDTNSGIIGSSVVITGTGFSATADDNTVRFGSTSAEVTAASATSLTVTVPPGISGTQAVTVQVEDVTSTGRNYAVTPVLTSLSAANGFVGSSLTLTGTGFSAATNGNTVNFGSATVTGTANAAGTSLSVNVPDGFGARSVSVTVDTQTSGSRTHKVTPYITSLSATEGSLGDIVDITGTGFDPTAANNTILLNGYPLTPTSPSAGVLRVTVPNIEAETAFFFVQGNPLSNSALFLIKPKITSLTTAAGEISSKAVLIRGQTLTISGTNFSTTAANNRVRFTMGATVINTVATTASATELTVVIPATVDVVGDVSVDMSVYTWSLASNPLTAVVPTVNLSVPNGGFY